MYYVIAVLALIFSLVSFWGKNKQVILLLQIPANIFYCLSFLMLQSIAGFIGVFIATIRTIVFYICDRRGKTPVLWLYLFCGLTVLFTSFNFKTIYDILPCVALTVFTIAAYQKNENVLRLGAMFLSVCLLIYNIVLGGTVGAVQELLLIISTTCAMISFNKKMKAE